MLCKEFIIANDSLVISGIFISLLLFSVYSFRGFLLDTYESVRQHLISSLIQENISLKNSLILNESLNILKIEFNSLDILNWYLPHMEEPNPLLNIN